MSDQPSSPSTSPWVGGNRHWESVLQHGIPRHLRPGDILYSQGGVAEYFYYLSKGKVRVSISSRDGSEKTLAIHEPGSLIGETSAYDGQPSFSSAVAVTETLVYAFSPSQITSVVRESPEIAHQLIQSLGAKMRVLAAQVSSLTFMDARGRIAYMLLQATEAVPMRPGLIRLTHQDVANLTGVSRVTVTNLLNDLQGEGIIGKSRSCIWVKDAARLRRCLNNNV